MFVIGLETLFNCYHGDQRCEPLIIEMLMNEYSRFVLIISITTLDAMARGKEPEFFCDF